MTDYVTFPPYPRVPTLPAAFDLAARGADHTPVVIFAQSGGQIADVLRVHDIRVSPVMTIDSSLLDDLPIDPDDFFRRETDRRRAILSRTTEEAMLRPGFSFADHGCGGPALDRFMLGTSPRPSVIDEPGPVSKRRRRRLRGQARGHRS